MTACAARNWATFTPTAYPNNEPPRVTDEERALIDAAVASGRVTRILPEVLSEFHQRRAREEFAAASARMKAIARGKRSNRKVS